MYKYGETVLVRGHIVKTFPPKENGETVSINNHCYTHLDEDDLNLIEREMLDISNEYLMGNENSKYGDLVWVKGTIINRVPAREGYQAVLVQTDDDEATLDIIETDLMKEM